MIRKVSALVFAGSLLGLVLLLGLATLPASQPEYAGEANNFGYLQRSSTYAIDRLTLRDLPAGPVYPGAPVSKPGAVQRSWGSIKQMFR